jgi:hypothetical protein
MLKKEQATINKRLESQIKKFKGYPINEIKKVNLKEKPQTKIDIISGRAGGYTLEEIKNVLIEEAKEKYMWKMKGTKSTYPVKLIQFHNGGFPKKGDEKGKYSQWAFKIPTFRE